METYQTLDIKNFNETITSVLPITEISIHTKLIDTKITKGCFIISIGTFPPMANLNIIRQKTSPINGSVGAESPKPKPTSKVLIERGVKNAIIHITLSVW